MSPCHSTQHSFISMPMEAASFSTAISTTLSANKISQHTKSTVEFPCNRRRCNHFIRNRRLAAPVANVSGVVDPVTAEVTWQIIVGAVAGVTPFVVAGFEFSKRIIAQRRCEVCGGSGLVFREKDYFKCPECGGFLPWQSWKRFFTG